MEPLENVVGSSFVTLRENLMEEICLWRMEPCRYKVGYEYCDFRVEKRNGRELCIYAGENMNRSALDVEIIVGNEYEMKSIPVSLAQTSKYEVDSIVYDWKACYILTIRWNLTIRW